MNKNNDNCNRCDVDTIAESLQSTNITSLPALSKVDLFGILNNKCADAFIEVEESDCDNQITAGRMSLRELRIFLDPNPLGHVKFDPLCTGDEPEHGYMVIDDREITRTDEPDFFTHLDTSSITKFNNLTVIKLSDIFDPARIEIGTGGTLGLTCGEQSGDADGEVTLGCDNLPRCSITATTTHNLKSPLKLVDGDGNPASAAAADAGDDTANVSKDTLAITGNVNVSATHQVGLNDSGNPVAFSTLPPVQAGQRKIKVNYGT